MIGPSLRSIVADGPVVHPGPAYLLNGRSFGDYFTLVKQLAFADMCTMTYMYFASGAVFAQSYFLSLIMRPSLGTALLGMSAFRIWHCLLFLKQLIQFIDS